MERRVFLKVLFNMLAWTLAGCGGYDHSSLVSSEQTLTKAIKFGLGNDPEKMINAYDLDGKRVLDALQPDIVCMWINGAKDNSGRVYSPSMDYIRNWAYRNRFKEWSDLGYDLMVITWENYDGQNTALGPPTYGDYHISNQFLLDLREFLSYIKSQYRNKLYIALATEQSTYTACRYERSCSDPLAYSDRITPITEEYFSELRSKLQEAVNFIKNEIPSADVGICFGGWLVEFEEGINFIKYFEPVINQGNAIFFQSMLGVKADENNGYGNPERILKNCKFFSYYGKRIHLAHYMPVNKRADVITDDLKKMSKPEYTKEISKYLSSFCFMDYGVLKNNDHNSLSSMVEFRNSLRGI